MTSGTEAQRLRSLLLKGGVGWLIDGMTEVNQELRLERFATDVQQVDAECQKRLGHAVHLLDALEGDPDRYRALIQTFAMPMTVQMRTMVYCVTNGADIQELDYEYRAKQTSRLRVKVGFRGGEGEHVFESDEHWDAEVLHHIGLAKLGDKPFIDGYWDFGRVDDSA